MNKSDSIKELAGALAKAQAEMEYASKDATNPHFKSSYATLASVWDAIRKPLSKNGLSVTQLVTSSESDVKVETILLHSSGEWLAETLSIPASKHDAQGFGSALTYARRYGLAAIAGVAPADDDGNAAVVSAPVRQSMTGDELASVHIKLEEASKKGVAALQTAWAAIPSDAKVALRDVKEKLKHQAADFDASRQAA